MNETEKRKIQDKVLEDYDLITEIYTNDNDIKIVGIIGQNEVTRTYKVENNG